MMLFAAISSIYNPLVETGDLDDKFHTVYTCDPHTTTSITINHEEMVPRFYMYYY